MSLFAVYAKQPDADKPQNLAETDVVFIKDRFSIFACLLTPIWCVWHRLWLELLAYIGVAFIMGFVAFFVGESAAAWIGFAIALLIGLEASSIRGFSLQRKGYQFKGNIVAFDHHEAEWRYVAGEVRQTQKGAKAGTNDTKTQSNEPGLAISTMPLSTEMPKGTVQ
jgi:hypothetical protein